MGAVDGVGELTLVLVLGVMITAINLAVALIECLTSLVLALM